MTVQKLCSAFVVAIAIAILHEPTFATNRSPRRPITSSSRHILFPAPVVASEQKSLPEPTDSPPPRQTKPGRGLDPERKSCNSPNQSLVALIPKENLGLTATDHPTFLFYVPDRAEDIRYGEFFINTQAEERVGQIVRFQLPDTPGIISVSLPELPENALEEGQMYHWYFKLYCQENKGQKTAPIEISNWMKRVPATSESEQEMGYDAIVFVAQQLLEKPEDSTWRERWRELLLKILDREGEALAEQPIVGSVVVIEESGR